MFHLKVQRVAGGPYEELDMLALRIIATRLRVSVNRAAELHLEVFQRQSEMTIPLRSHVVFWDPDEGKDEDGNPQTEDNPFFEGFVQEIQPAESNLQKVVCC